MNLLRRQGYLPKMLGKIEGYFLKMARTTGTYGKMTPPWPAAAMAHRVLLEAQRAGFTA